MGLFQNGYLQKTDNPVISYPEHDNPVIAVMKQLEGE